jgi:hypothetical protein
MMQASAFSRLKGRILLGQWVGNLLFMLLAAGWLQIADSHAWQFAFSVLSAGLLVVAFLWFYVAMFRHLRPSAAPPPRWLGCLLLGFFVALWLLLLQPIAAGRAHESLVAGYLNSQSPTWVRYHLGYSKLVAWQERIYDCIHWLWARAGCAVPSASIATGSTGFQCWSAAWVDRRLPGRWRNGRRPPAWRARH